MPKILITEEQKQAVKLEVENIMTDVVSKWLPTLEKRQYPRIAVKLGGHSAAYYLIDGEDVHLIKVRYNVWIHLCLAQKRLLIIHEFFHSLGFNHSGKQSYLSANDMMSYLIYWKIYGEDDAYCEWKHKMQANLSEIDLSIPKINKRKIKYFKGNII